MRAMMWTANSTVIMRDHQPCLRTARSKHQARTGQRGLTLGRLDGFCRPMSFCRSIHSRLGCVRNAVPVLELKLPMMMLRGEGGTLAREAGRTRRTCART